MLHVPFAADISSWLLSCKVFPGFIAAFVFIVLLFYFLLAYISKYYLHYIKFIICICMLFFLLSFNVLKFFKLVITGRESLVSNVREGKEDWIFSGFLFFSLIQWFIALLLGYVCEGLFFNYYSYTYLYTYICVCL